jgi:hypothetical protein
LWSEAAHHAWRTQKQSSLCAPCTMSIVSTRSRNPTRHVSSITVSQPKRGTFSIQPRTGSSILTSHKQTHKWHSQDLRAALWVQLCVDGSTGAKPRLGQLRNHKVCSSLQTRSYLCHSDRYIAFLPIHICIETCLQARIAVVLQR